MRPNPFHDVVAFLTRPEWPTFVFWLLLLASGAAAIAAWRRMPEQRSARQLGIWMLRCVVGAMWWQQSLWKIPPNYAGLVYWMRQMVDHAAIQLQSEFVAAIVLPHISLFGPLVYLIEVAIGTSLMLGLFSRLGALAGVLMAINLWLGLYSVPGEWPWTYFFLVVIQLLFAIDPPGRSLGVDVLLGLRFRRAMLFRAVSGLSLDCLHSLGAHLAQPLQRIGHPIAPPLFRCPLLPGRIPVIVAAAAPSRAQCYRKETRMIRRRAMMTAGAAVAMAAATWRPAAAEDTPGVTATEIKIGNTMPYSGPVSSYSPIGKTETAFFKMVNEQGGVAGHKIDFISLDDGYSPPKTFEDARRLVEEDKVAFLFGTLGTPTNTAIVRYVNQKKVPHLFVATGAAKWGDYKLYPWTMGFQPDYQTEAQIYAKYILKQKPNAKVAVLYQNDDFGKDYLVGLRKVFGARYAKMVTEATYEPTDPTIDSQIATLQGSGADVLVVAAAPKFAAQSIRKVYELGWKPLFCMTNVSISVGSVLTPAGPEKAIGMISTNYIKDPTDHQWDNDAGMQEWRGFMAKNMPGADLTDSNYVYGYSAAKTMLQVLKQCNGNFSRTNIMKQAESLHNLELPTLLPGIKVNTGHTDHRPIKAMRLEKWDGKTWVLFGDIIEATAS